MRAVIERESHKWKVRSHAIDDVGSEPFEEFENEQRLRPKQKQPDYCKGAARHEKHESAFHAKSTNYRFSNRHPETSGRAGSP